MDLTNNPVHGQGNSAIGNSAITINSSHVLIDDGDSLVLLYQGPGLSFNCLCHQSFNTCPVLERHLSVCTTPRSSISSNIDNFRCCLCMESLSSIARISSHYKRCKTLTVRPEPNTLASHSSRDQGNVGVFPCKYCARHFDTAIGRGQHAKKAHGTELFNDAKKDKVPRWTLAEHNLLVEAEAHIRIRHSLEDDRVIRDNSLNDEIHEYMCLALPDFTRTKSSVHQRRTKGDTEAFLASVLARKREILAEKSALIASQDILASMHPDYIISDENDSGSSLVRSELHGNNDVPLDLISDPCLSASAVHFDKCHCKDDLLTAINCHLQSMKADSGTEAIRDYLQGILDDLNAYEVANFSKIMRKIKPENMTECTTREASKSSAQLTYAGRKAKVKAAACAVVRNIFENQGHKRCLQYLRNPSDAGLCSRATVELFKTVFEDRSGADDLQPFIGKPAQGNSHTIHMPVDESEVVAQLRQLKKSTAPGPDGIRTADLLQMNPADLACLFNIFLYHKDVPRALKINKTTMIPKSGQPDVGNWRPITIASIVDRLFAKVLEVRLSRTVLLDPNQRGFLKSLDGCGENITAYGGALRYSRTHVKPIVVMCVDLAKAFDSVKYSTIMRALARMGIDKTSIELLMNLCHGQTTSIKHQEGVEDVKLNKGVRQGWPLSPVLFLIVVDELLCRLKEADGFLVESPSLDRAYLTGLAFADDVILYSNSEHGMNRHLEKTISWCTARDLKINPQKSTVLYLKREPHMKRVLLSPISISIEGVKIPEVSDSFERVLGVHLHYTGKVDHRMGKFGEDLELVCNSALRPTQKVSMIQCCLIPMIKFRLVYGFANKGALSQIDKIVRKAVRKIMHLPSYINNEALHATRKHGGLGIPCLSDAVPLAQAKLITRMNSSSNPVTRMLVDARILYKFSERYSEQLGTQEVEGSSLDKLNHNLIDGRVSNFINTTQGAGWTLFHRAPRLFLDTPRLRRWTEKDAIDAVKMRSNVLMTRELIARTVAHGLGTDKSCRACHQSVETQAHILSKCPSTQKDRIARHDHVCAYLTKRLQSRNDGLDSLRNRVHREFRVVIQPGEVEGFILPRELRPDIAVILDDRIIIIEVSVVYESERTQGDNTLKLIRRYKKRKYEPLRAVLSSRFDRRCVVRPLIVGCRGGWLASNNKVFAGTGVTLTEHDRNCCVERAVRGSLLTYRRFIARTFEPLIRHEQRNEPA